MKQFDFKDCIEEGLLRRVPPSAQKAESSMQASARWLEEARKNLKTSALNSSVMASYMAMFHAARAILFLDGFREKSHYCIARYLEEKYTRTGALENKWIEILDHQRELRHNSQYDTNFIMAESEAEDALEIAENFTERMRVLLSALRRGMK